MEAKIKGIDVSYHNGVIDWNKVLKDNIKFAIIREGYRKTIDSQFLNNVKNAKENEIPIMVYHFIYIDNATIKENAQSTVSNMIKANLDISSTWVWVDLEYDTWIKCGQTCTKDLCSKYTQQYINELKSLGCNNVGIYMNKDYYKNYYTKEILDEYPIWLADYNGEPDYDCVIQQYSDSGTVNGIDSTDVDMNYLFDLNMLKNENKVETENYGGDIMTTDKVKELAKSLLKHYPFVYCPTLAGYTSNRTPHRGDIVLFYNGSRFYHTGIVYKVDSTYFYTIEGNTSGASRVESNGGGVYEKKYTIKNYTSCKFFRPDYSILVNEKVFSSTSKAIDCLINVASNEVGYKEKASNAYLDSKNSNAGANNYTKYWRDIKPSYQGEPWCACFVTWCVQNMILTGEKKTSSSTPSSDNKTYVGKGIGTGVALYNMNVRDNNSSSDGKIIGSVNKGETVEVLSITSNGWFKIVWTKCTKGYAYVSYQDGKYFTYKKNSTATKKTASEEPKSFSEKLEGTYIVNVSKELNVRDGAGTDNKILVSIPNGTKVKNYGYYTTVSGTKWLYVKFTYNNITYIGFASSKYLKKE